MDSTKRKVLMNLGMSKLQCLTEHDLLQSKWMELRSAGIEVSSITGKTDTGHLTEEQHTNCATTKEKMIDTMAQLA